MRRTPVVEQNQTIPTHGKGQSLHSSPHKMAETINQFFLGLKTPT